MLFWVKLLARDFKLFITANILSLSAAEYEIRQGYEQNLSANYSVIMPGDVVQGNLSSPATSGTVEVFVLQLPAGMDKAGIASETHCYTHLNTLGPRQNGRHFPDDIFKCISLNEDVWTSLKISLKFVPNVRINNIPALVQIMAWRRPGDKPLSEPIMFSVLTHICVTRSQWVKLLGQIMPTYILWYSTV